MLIRNGVFFDGEKFCSDMALRLWQGRVTEVGPGLQPVEDEWTLDLAGDYLLPGFVDVHIHAYQGQDTMAGENAVRGMSRGLYQQGVAAFCPTTMSASETDTAKALEGIRAVMRRQEPRGAQVLGAHMEAPFMNPGKAGAQLKEFFQNPDRTAFTRMGGDADIVRLITLAPELPGTEEFVRWAVAAGIHVSVGHTAATAEQVHQAAVWGADHVTHTFNAQTPLHHREPGVPGAALTDDRLYCEMICDGVHLHGDIVRLIARCKGAAKAVAITDAMEAAGMPEGSYTLGGQVVIVRGAEARLKDGTLAGSVLTMEKALENLIHRFGVEPETACAMCTSTPAASVGEEKAGWLRPGSPAPLTRWSAEWHMKGIVTE